MSDLGLCERCTSVGRSPSLPAEYNIQKIEDKTVWLRVCTKCFTELRREDWALMPYKGDT